MPIQFYIKVNLDKADKVNKKDLKQQLKRFKQVYKILDSFKGADHQQMKTCGKNEKAYVSDKGLDQDYNFREKTIKKGIKAEKKKDDRINDLQEAYISDNLKVNESIKDLKAAVTSKIV